MGNKTLPHGRKKRKSNDNWKKAIETKRKLRAASSSENKAHVEVPVKDFILTPGPSTDPTDPLTTIKTEPEEQHIDPENLDINLEEPCEYLIHFEEEDEIPLMQEPQSVPLDPLTPVKLESDELHHEIEIKAEKVDVTPSTTLLNKSFKEIGERNNWAQKVLPGVIAGYAPRDVFSALEFGLLYKLDPKQNPSTATTADLQFVNILICANSDGSETLPLLVMTEFIKFSPKLCESLPNNVISYKYRDAKLTSCRFITWLRTLDLNFKAQNRNIVFFSHNNQKFNVNFRLHNIKFVYMPTEIIKHPLTSVADLIRKLYKLRLLYRGMSSHKSEVTVQDAFLYLSATWESVTANDIRKGYNEAWFGEESSVETEDSNSKVSAVLRYYKCYSSDTDDIVISQQLAKRQNLRGCTDIHPEIIPKKPLPVDALASIQEVRRLLSMHPHSTDALHSMNAVENHILSIINTLNK